MANKVSVDVRVPGAKQATAEIHSVRDAFERLQKGGAKGFQIGAAAAVTTKAFNLAGAAIGGVTDYLKNSADAFREDEVSIQQLTTSLRANVEGFDGNTRAIEDRIKAGQALGFSDEEQRKSVGTLVGAYGDVTKSLNVMRIAQDLARYSGVDLATASDVLIKVHAGSFRALKALGISTKGVTDANQALAMVQKIVSGQAEDYANTLTGKLAVAEEKASEASEKFGKTVAKVESVILPAVTDAVSRAADAFDVWQTMLDSNATSVEKNDVLIQGLNDSVVASWPGVKEYVKQLERQNLGYIEAGDSGRRLGGIVDDAAKAMDDSIPAAKALASRLGQLEQAGKDAAGAIDGLSTALDDRLFGKAITAGHEAAIKQNIADLEKQAKAAKKNSPEFTILAGKIAEEKQALFDLHLEQAKKAGPEAALAFLRKERANATGATNEIDKLIQAYLDLSAAQTHVKPVIHLSGSKWFSGKTLPGNAAGGPVTAGEPSIVGEKGPEIFVPNSNGRIIPNGATGGGSGMTALHFHFPNALGMTPGGAEMVARAVEPIITRTLQRRGHLAGARAF